MLCNVVLKHQHLTTPLSALGCLRGLALRFTSSHPHTLTPSQLHVHVHSTLSLPVCRSCSQMCASVSFPNPHLWVLKRLGTGLGPGHPWESSNKWCTCYLWESKLLEISKWCTCLPYLWESKLLDSKWCTCYTYLWESKLLEISVTATCTCTFGSRNY